MDRVAIVSPYKRRGGPRITSASDSALNGYTEMLAYALSESATVLVIAPRCGKPERWHDRDVTVVESYTRGSPLATLEIGIGALKSKAPLIHVQHELFAFGGFISALSLPIVLRVLRARGRRLATTIHGVIPLASVTKEFVRRNGSWLPASVARYAWRRLLRSVCTASDVVVVHDDRHRAALVGDYGVTTPIEVIPHGAPAYVPLTDAQRAEARASFHIPPDAEVLTFFGYFAGYKGLEELAEAAPEILERRPRLHLVFAGEIPERLRSRARIGTQIAALRARFARVHVTGFVPEEGVRDVFAATDALILPYTAGISASGPLALAAGYGTPALLSSFLAPHTDATFAFEPTASGIVSAVDRFFDDASVRDEARRFVAALGRSNDWKNVAEHHLDLYRTLSRAART